MKVQHNAPVEDRWTTRVLAVWETFEDMPSRMTDDGEERHALTRVVRRYAREIDEEAMEDSLAVRLEATQGSTVDRFESPGLDGGPGRAEEARDPAHRRAASRPRSLGPARRARERRASRPNERQLGLRAAR
ncbi:MAG: hypothetical protein SangKO_090200 [Sandaracinaceae bacterium]